MKILCDLHHEDLFRSLVLLFENRLGWEVYRPVGMEWFDQGFWSYTFPARDTAQQFLTSQAYSHYKSVTLEQFLSIDFDVILSSTPPSYRAFQHLRDTYETKAKHIFQMGNQWPVPDGCENLLNSTTVQIPKTCNGVHYHQEFDLGAPSGSTSTDIINMMHYMPDVARFEAVEKALPSGWLCKAFGAGNRDSQPRSPAGAIAATGYLWHSKAVEAFGYNVHRAAAFGVPIIMRAAANKHQTCGAFLTPGETCIDMDDFANPADLAKEILRFDDHWIEHSKAIRQAFHRAVNFNEEEKAIREWLGALR